VVAPLNQRLFASARVANTDFHHQRLEDALDKGKASETQAQYWQGQIEPWRVSGQSQLAYCKANGLNYRRFGYWLRKFRRQGGT
jgi:hypothetical protein